MRYFSFLLTIFIVTISVSYGATHRDGTVIIVENGFLSRPITKITGSGKCHCAIILYQGGQPWVYEATLPHVRKMPLVDYQKWLEQRRLRCMSRGLTNRSIYYRQPKTPYTVEQLARMKIYAESQLGRKYMMRGYWKQRKVRGTHCSQFVSEVIAQSYRIQSDGSKETPRSLDEKIENISLAL